MSSLGDVMKGIKDVVVLVDKLATVEAKLDALESTVVANGERLAKVEVVVDFLKPAISRRLSGPIRP